MTTDASYEKSADLIGHIKFLPWGQLDGCSVTRPFFSLRRVWLARLGQMLEKRGEFAIRIFPEGWVLSQDCPNPSTHIFSCYTLCTTVRYGVFVRVHRGMVRRIVGQKVSLSALMEALVMLVSATCTLGVVNGVNALIGNKLKRLLKTRWVYFPELYLILLRLCTLFCGRGLQEPVIFQPDKFCHLMFWYYLCISHSSSGNCKLGCMIKFLWWKFVIC